MREKGNRDQGARGCPRRVSRPNCVADGKRAPHATLTRFGRVEIARIHG